MTYARDLILTLTILAIIFTADNWPKPVKAAEVVPYCIITYKALGKDMFGRKVVGWASGCGLCSLQDIYREI